MNRLSFTVIAPSSTLGQDLLDAGAQWLRDQGHKVSFHEQTSKVLHQSAGTHDDKIHALHDSFSNPEVDVILCAVGGNRALHLLDKIDYDLIAKNKKPFIGFSDATALLNALWVKSGIPTIHGPTLNRFAKMDNEQLQQCIDLATYKPTYIPIDQASVISNGKVKGQVIGGNLSVFQALCGTQYIPDFKGKVLFLEDIGDEMSRYDRMMGQLRLCGAFDECSAVLFGNISESKDTGRKPFGFTLDDMINEHCANVKGPIIKDMPFGHIGDFWSLPIGKEIEVNTEETKIIL